MSTSIIPDDAAIDMAQAYLASQGVTLSQEQLLELASRLQGFSDRAAMQAALLPSDEDMERICMQYEVATQEAGAVARELVEKIGMPEALEQWSSERELVISLAPFIVRSEEATGYWNEHQGWVFDKRSATGYAADRRDNWSELQSDAKLVSYDTAIDFPID
jgi:hypothetical protein